MLFALLLMFTKIMFMTNVVLFHAFSWHLPGSFNLEAYVLHICKLVFYDSLCLKFSFPSSWIVYYLDV